MFRDIMKRELRLLESDLDRAGNLFANIQWHL